MRRSATSSGCWWNGCSPVRPSARPPRPRPPPEPCMSGRSSTAAARRSLFRQILQRLHESGNPPRALRPQRKPPRRSARPTEGWPGRRSAPSRRNYGIDLFAERSVLYPARALRSWITDLGPPAPPWGPSTSHLTSDHAGRADLGVARWALADRRLAVVLQLHRPDISLCTKSRQLAEDVRLLLRRVGVRSSIPGGGWFAGRCTWSVSIARDGYDRLRQMPLVER